MEKSPIQKQSLAQQLLQTAKDTESQRLLYIGLSVMLAMLLRLYLFPVQSGDYLQFLQGWFASIKEHGGLAAIGMQIGDYMPPYFYILALLTYIPLSDLYLIKLASCAADVVLAFFVMRLVCLRWPTGNAGALAFAAVLFLPPVFLNSAAWAQCDAIFTAALVASLYYLAVNRPRRAVLAFSIAFVFKLQAVFFAPFLLLMVFKGRVKLRTLLLFPLTYLASILPAALMGRSFGDLLTVYVSQSKLYASLCMGIPNLYAFLDGVQSQEISRAGVLLAGGVVLTALYLLLQKRFSLSAPMLVSLAFFFCLLLPYLLPHMHERYYYLADLVGLVFAFYFPRRFWMPLLLTAADTLAHANFLFGLHPTSQYFLQLESLAVLALLCLLVWHILRLCRAGQRALPPTPAGVAP